MTWQMKRVWMLLQLVRHKMPKGMDKYSFSVSKCIDEKREVETVAELKDYAVWKSVEREREKKWWWW